MYAERHISTIYLISVITNTKQWISLSSYEQVNQNILQVCPDRSLALVITLAADGCLIVIFKAVIDRIYNLIDLSMIQLDVNI